MTTAARRHLTVLPHPPESHQRLVTDDDAEDVVTETERAEPAYAMTFDEIAREMGCSRQNIQQTIERALRKLKPVMLSALNDRDRVHVAPVLRIVRAGNYEAVCACGCEGRFLRYDAHGRSRYYLNGHGGRSKR